MPGQPPIPKHEPWELYPSGEVLERYMVEVVDSKAEGFRETVPGAPHPNRSLYPNHRFCNETPVQGSDRLINQFWSTGEYNIDVYNYSIDYAENSASHPLWARRYRIRRDLYTPTARGTAFTGVYLVKVTAGGSGYTKAPEVTATGGSGSGATFTAILNTAGAVAWVRVSAEGTGYTSAPTLSFTGGGGSGAAATAYVQGAAILWQEKVEEMPRDDPRSTIYVTVLRVWKTLPGPLLTSVGNERQRSFGGKATTTTQEVLASTATQADPTFASGILESRLVSVDSVISKQELVTDYNGGVFQPVWETHIDETTGICVDISYTWVAAGTLGGQGNVLTLAVNNAGSGYTPTTPIVAGTPTPTTAYYDVTFTGGGGHGATGKAIVGAGGTVTSVVLTYGGAGYTSAPTVTLTGHGGSGATFTTTLGNGYVEVQKYDQWASIAVTSMLRDGSGFAAGFGASTLPEDQVYSITKPDSFPDQLSSGSTSAPTFFQLASGEIRPNYKQTQGYSGPCRARFTRKYMTEAAYAAWSAGTAGKVDRLTLVSGGTGYTSGALTFTGGGGTGAAGTFVAVGGVITSVTLTAGGSGYTSAPTVGMGSGSGGSVTCRLLGGTVFINTPSIYQWYPTSSALDVNISGTHYYVARLPTALHDSVSLFSGALTLPATVPVSLTPGDWLVRAIKTEQQRLGFWIVEVEEVRVPDPSTTAG